jgi:hypothetical protein
MPLDSNILQFNANRTNNVFGDIPEAINFDIAFEPTRMKGKNYVVNTTTDDVVGIVGDRYPYNPHPEYFKQVQEAIIENLSVHDTTDAQVRWKSGRWGAFALMDITLPNVRYTVTTKKHQTDVAQRIIALHGVDGLCSNQVFFGAIDFFCTNGCISGDWDKVRRKNTANFNLDKFIDELNDAKTDFHQHGRMLQTWADRETDVLQVREALFAIMKSDRAVDKMTSLFVTEANTRGYNVFSLYSAMTNYATYADDRNGFNLRASDNDNRAITMFGREQNVSQWVSHPAFKALAA